MMSSNMSCILAGLWSLKGSVSLYSMGCPSSSSPQAAGSWTGMNWRQTSTASMLCVTVSWWVGENCSVMGRDSQGKEQWVHAHLVTSLWLHQEMFLKLQLHLWGQSWAGKSFHVLGGCYSSSDLREDPQTYQKWVFGGVKCKCQGWS